MAPATATPADPAPVDPAAALTRPIDLIRPGETGAAPDGTRAIAVEAPVSIEFNGLAYAVMMATPVDLADFVTGFALSEQLVTRAEGLAEIDIVEVEKGWVARVQLADDADTELLLARLRRRVSESSCGLCGMDNLDAVTRDLPRLPVGEPVASDAIFRALGDLRAHQPLNRLTGAVHAAAFADRDGTILEVREDVGRHNALDKLIGALARTGKRASDGFLLVSSRCSYEMVEKAVLAGATTLVTISAPTSLAVARAQAAGLTLVTLARSDSAWVLRPGD